MLERIRNFFIPAPPRPQFPEVNEKIAEAERQSDLDKKVALLCEAALLLPRDERERIDDIQGSALRSIYPLTADPEHITAICHIVKLHLCLNESIGTEYRVTGLLAQAEDLQDRYVEDLTAQHGKKGLETLSTICAQGFLEIAELYPIDNGFRSHIAMTKAYPHAIREPRAHESITSLLRIATILSLEYQGTTRVYTEEHTPSKPTSTKFMQLFSR